MLDKLFELLFLPRNYAEKHEFFSTIPSYGKTWTFSVLHFFGNHLVQRLNFRREAVQCDSRPGKAKSTAMP